MNKLDARLDRLENAVGIGGIDITIFIDLLPSGQLTGVRVGRAVVERPPAEPESVFISRMRAEHRRVGVNAILLIGERCE